MRNRNGKLIIILIGLLIVGLVGCATATKQKILIPGVSDEYEPNDVIFNAVDIGLNRPIKATINPAGDIDYYRVYIPQISNQRQEIRVTVLNQAENLQLVLIFYDQNREEMANAKAGGKGAREIAGYFLSYPGQTDYYIAVFSAEQPYIGYVDKEGSPEFYTLTVKRR